MATPENFGFPAPELLLGREHHRPYGIRQEGVVLSQDTETPVTLRMPAEGSDSAYVFANGWTADKNSMRLPAIEAVHAGHCAVTFSYTNTGTKEALEGNAKEMAAIIDALPGDLERNAAGLSMGGWVTAEALKRVNTRVHTATLIASAGFISRTPSTMEVIQHFSAEYPELAVHYLKDPINTARLGYASARNVARRLLAVGAEIGELTHGSAHDTIHTVKAAPDAPYIRFAYGDDDKLIPPHAQEEGIVGVPFDEVWKYHGGHVEAVFSRAFSQSLFERGAHLPYPEPVPIAA